MNELFYSLLFIIIIVILVLIFVLIYYFYNNYDDNRNNVNNNFSKTTKYINDTNKDFSKNLNILSDNINKVDNNYKDITNKTNSNLLEFNKTAENNTSNLRTDLNNYDNNLKQYFEFNDNNRKINEALYNYKFSVPPNLSMTLLKDINVASSMTINTSPNKSFRICQDATSNCIDLNVNDGKFNIKPSNNATNNINSLNIATKDDKSLANFDFANNSIYLGSNQENAGLYIKENKVYVKDLYILKSGTNYSSVGTENLYNSELPNTQSYNMYKLNDAYLTKTYNIPKIIELEYTINQKTTGTPSVITYDIIIIIKSKFQILSGTTIDFYIDGIQYVSLPALVNIANSTSGSKISKLSIFGYKGTLSLNANIEPNTTETFTNNGISGLSFTDATTSVINKKIMISF